MIGKHY